MSQLHGNEDVNDFSIGIELVDATNYNDPYPLEQLATLTRLCAHLCYTYRIQINRIVGHADIVMPHGRKIDPGADFPWYDFLREVVHYTGE
jgi:N-acetylmuramoyl-L-alanine amidase